MTSCTLKRVLCYRGGVKVRVGLGLRKSAFIKITCSYDTMVVFKFCRVRVGGRVEWKQLGYRAGRDGRMVG